MKPAITEVNKNRGVTVYNTQDFCHALLRKLVRCLDFHRFYIYMYIIILHFIQGDSEKSQKSGNYGNKNSLDILCNKLKAIKHLII